MEQGEEFLEVLKEYADFLGSSKAPGAGHWFQMLREASVWSDSRTIANKVLSFYGGMGSINDMVFPFGSAERDRDETLRERLYVLAKSVSRGNEA